MMGWDDFLLVLAITFVFNVVASILAPKPKKEKPNYAGGSSPEMEAPTAEAGRPIPVVFGTITIKGGNVLWYGDKSKKEYDV